MTTKAFRSGHCLGLWAVQLIEDVAATMLDAAVILLDLLVKAVRRAFC